MGKYTVFVVMNNMMLLNYAFIGHQLPPLRLP
jgi:hypothetical protein